MTFRLIAPALLALTVVGSSGCYHAHRDFHRFERNERRWENRQDRRDYRDRNDYRDRDRRRWWWFDRH